MTDRLSEEQLDAEIRTFLGWQAEDVAAAPTATEIAIRLGPGTGDGTGVLRLAPRIGWILVAGLLVIALVGVAVMGALPSFRDPVAVDGPMPQVSAPIPAGNHPLTPVSDPAPVGYEAVFVRRDVASGSPELVVVAIGIDGRERPIARLRGGGWTSSTGTVSPTGLLAVPTTRDGWLMSYEVVDLHRPEAEPVRVADIEQDEEQVQRTPYYDTGMRPGLFWGPGERLAVPWYERNLQPSHLAFVDGRTGAAQSVDVPEGAMLLPYWASDGTGVLVDPDAGPGPAWAMLTPTGLDRDATPGFADGSYSRHVRADGAFIKESGGAVRQGDRVLLSLDRTNIVDVAWTAAGNGLWVVTRSDANGRDLRIVRRVLPSGDPAAIATIEDAPTEPAGSRPSGRLIGLAPDDSMLILSLDRVSGTADNGSTEPVIATEFVSPANGLSFSVEGTFAGWLGTYR